MHLLQARAWILFGTRPWHLLSFIISSTSCTITVPICSAGGWGTERLRKLFRATQLVRDGGRFKSRQHDSKVHILNICTAFHNFPLVQSLSHFPFTTLPLPCFKGKEQGCPRSELCLVSVATHHSGLLPTTPYHPPKGRFVFASRISQQLCIPAHTLIPCLASFSLLRCNVNKSKNRENGELASYVYWLYRNPHKITIKNLLEIICINLPTFGKTWGARHICGPKGQHDSFVIVELIALSVLVTINWEMAAVKSPLLFSMPTVFALWLAQSVPCWESCVGNSHSSGMVCLCLLAGMPSLLSRCLKPSYQLSTI